MRIVCAFLALCIAGPVRAEAPRTLTVYAAASLTDVFKRLGREFEKMHPGVKVRFNFAASNILAIQINEGAPVDIFASASERTMEVVRKGCGTETPRILVRNRLAVVVPAENPARITRFQDLARPGVKLILAAPGVPAGDFAREAFRKAGILDTALRNVVSNEENVRSALGKVWLGEADASIVYVTDARERRGVRAIPIPDEFNVATVYPIAVLRGSPNAELARAFVRLTATQWAKNLFRARGFHAS